MTNSSINRPLGIGLSVQSEGSFVNEKEFFSSIQSSRLTAEFSVLIKEVGFLRALRSLIERKKYIVRLWSVREAAIIRILSVNYEKIDRWTISRLIAWLYKKSAIVRRLLWKIEQGLNINNI